MDPQSIGGYVNRALERRLIGDPASAIVDYDAAIRNFPEDMGDVDTRPFGRVYRDRGQTCFELGHQDQAFADYNRARELGHHMYYNEKGEEGPRLDDIPEQLEEYKPLSTDGDQN